MNYKKTKTDLFKKFGINDLVLIKLEKSLPYRVIEILPDSMYKIQNKFETHIVHISIK